MLHNGQRMERQIDKSGMRISEFDVYGARIGTDTVTSQDALPPRALPTVALLRDPDTANLGELGWRLGMLFAAMNFVLLALTVSSVNPRAGRSGNLLFALFAFVVYYNLLNLGENWVGSGRYSLGGFLLALHGGVLAIGLLWLAKRHNNWGWPRRRARAARPTAAAPASP
jgi:lipopolysaccharide export system permease protein